MDKLEIKLSVIMDEDFKNELRELIKDLVKEEVEKVTKQQYIPYPIPYHPGYPINPIWVSSEGKPAYPKTIEITCK